MFSQPQSEAVECLSPHVLEEGIAQQLLDERLVSQQPERTSPLHPVSTSSQEKTEPLNVLAHGKSSVGAYTFDMVVLPELTSEITQLPTLEPKRFIRDLHSGKVYQICVFVAEDEHVTDMR